MNKKERQSFVNKVLYDAYREKFLDFKKKVRAEIVLKIPKRFLKLYNNEDDRKYLVRCAVNEILFSDKNVFCMPDFGNCQNYMPDFVYRSSLEDGFEKVRYSDLKVPHSMDTVKLLDSDLLAEYIELWGSYLKAYQEISSLAYSYRSRDKFAAEFPEFAKYLPEKVTIVRLPMIQVDVARDGLASVGIPAKSTEC